ncbi:MAG TPA: hypothetical protein VHG91_00250 [Longimicrobium sp.]|nr:hypothetical protein [Longimicrobium sp.]
MKKLALNLDELDVHSFETATPGLDDRGTVDAHSFGTTDRLIDRAVSWLLACVANATDQQ